MENHIIDDVGGEPWRAAAPTRPPAAPPRRKEKIRQCWKSLKKRIFLRMECENNKITVVILILPTLKKHE